METNSNASAHRPEDNPGSLELPGFLITLSQVVAKIHNEPESQKAGGNDEGDPLSGLQLFEIKVYGVTAQLHNQFRRLRFAVSLCNSEKEKFRKAYQECQLLQLLHTEWKAYYDDFTATFAKYGFEPIPK